MIVIIIHIVAVLCNSYRNEGAAIPRVLEHMLHLLPSKTYSWKKKIQMSTSLS